MTTLPYRRQQVTPRSGGRIAEGRQNAIQRDGRYSAHAVNGSAALAPERSADRPRVGTARLRVAPPAPVSAPRAPFVAMLLVVVVAGVLGILVLNTKINENAFRLGAL